jgi:ACS family glucarate transporter-like MFS transporter
MWSALLTSRSLWCIACLYIFSSFGWSFFVSWMPRYLKDVHGVTFEKSEWMSALPLFCGGISCLVGGTLCDLAVKTTGRKRLMRALFPICGYSVAALAMIGVSRAKSAQEAAVLMCIAAAANDFGQASNWASIVDIGGRFAGTATGFINMIGNTGNWIQPYIGARIFNRFGWTALFAVYACTFIVAASMWLFINPTRTFYEGKLQVPDDEPHAAD